MFRKRFDIDIPDQRQELRDFFAERLRLALDFATLGAYELTGVEGDAPPAGERSEPRSCASATRGITRRHVSDASLPCSAPTVGQRAPLSCGRGGRRAGAVATSAQPCICAGR